MDLHRNSFNDKIPFPYGEPVDDQFLGRNYVLDTVANPDACSDLAKYVTAHLPRIHCFD